MERPIVRRQMAGRRATGQQPRDRLDAVRVAAAGAGLEAAAAFACPSASVRYPEDMDTASKVVELAADIANFALPKGVDRRLQFLLDKQDQGEVLSDDERSEAEGIIEIDALLSLLRLQVK